MSRSPLPPRRRALGWLLGLGGLALLTVVLSNLRSTIELPTVLVIFLGLVVTTAAVGGRLPAFVAAVGGFLSANWYFTPPFHRLAIADAEHAVALVVSLGVAALVSHFVDAAAHRRLEAERARSEARRAQLLAEANELRTALLQAVSHDLRTPLASVKASVSSLRQDDVTWSQEETGEFLGTISEETDRLIALVDQPPRHEPHPGRRGAAGIGGGRPRGGRPRRPGQPRASGRRRRRRAGRDPPGSAGRRRPARAGPGQRDRQRRRGSRPAGRRVRVEAGAFGGRIDVRVIDQGAGIPPVDRDRVFQPFQRLGDHHAGQRRRPRPRRRPGLRQRHGRHDRDRRHARRRGDGRHQPPDRPHGDGPVSTRVLAVDDEPPILRALAANLRARGYEVDLAATGEAALELASRHAPDVVILDLGLPGMSGLEVIQGLRGWSRVPILILSAREAQADKVAALDAGADDYVTKPFGMDELLARLRAALRRARTDRRRTRWWRPPTSASTSAAKQVTTADGEVRLTPIEWHLVEILVRNPGRLVTARHLLEEVWGPQYGTETNYLRVHFAHIRRKLEPEPSRPRYFITEPGMGYRFEPNPPPGR